MTVALALALVCRIGAEGQLMTVERVIRASFVLPPGTVLAFDHRYGSISVTGTISDSVVMESRVKVSGRSAERVRWLGEHIDVVVRFGPETLRVVTSYPDVPADDSTLCSEVDVKARVPAQSPLVVSNVFGDVQIQGARNHCRAFARYGHIDVFGCAVAEVIGRYSDVTVQDLRGSLAVDNDFGDVSLCDVSGRVRVANRYGRVNLERTRGHVGISNSFGDVECRQDSGVLAVDNRAGDVRAWLMDEQLAELSLVARMGGVELNVRPGIGSRIRGLARRGMVSAGLPLQVVEDGEWRRIAGLLGAGVSDVVLLTCNGDVVVREVTSADSSPAKRE
uniref:Adhesin domain-containing protein n=1 Tax=candidate division WOR-3 bacterium TaxID=2052148 RepID=A0A7C4GGA7_UNCW3